MTPDFLRWLTGLIEAGDVHPFYVCREWLQVSQQVRRRPRKAAKPVRLYFLF